jgi:signal transduction histidine kinase
MDAGLAIIDKDYNVVWANKILISAGVCADKKCYQTFTKLNHVCPDCGVKKVIEQNLDLDVHEYSFIDSKGEKAWVELRVSPLRDKEGNVTSAIELAVPITERKKIEEQLIADQSKLEIVNEKLQVVGSLTRHDVANKLSTANSNAYLLKKKLKDQPELLVFVEGIELAIKQSSRLFEFSHLYEKIGAEEPGQIDVAASLEQAIALVPNFGVELVNNTAGLKVLADSMLRQLFYAFIDNSLKHGNNVTKIVVSYSEINDETKIIYEDNGAGIPDEYKGKIFASGFTTGGGSGRGLKLVSRLAKAYGWSIKENGIFGKGAKFEITIPHKKN